MKRFAIKLVALVLTLITAVSISIVTPTPAHAAGGTIVSQAEISAAASTYNIPTNSNAYSALQKINTYYSQLTGYQNGTLVFFFEGVGNNSSPSARMNAMCVVIKAGRIKYINRNSSTIPDCPFDPSKNGGDAMPTLKSGVYTFKETLHKGFNSPTPAYAALHIYGDTVLRHFNQYNYYYGTSGNINIHRRTNNTLNRNSCGCIIVGNVPNINSTSSEYARFIQAVGIVGSNGTASSNQVNPVTGKVIIDRSFADSYFTAVGYTIGARSMLGANQTQVYYLDLNCKVNGTQYSTLSGIGTADVYIDGTKVMNDCTDFYAKFPVGTVWLITDIKPKAGYTYTGPSFLTGIITSTKYVDLQFSTGSSSWSTNFRMKAGAYFNAYDGVNGNYVGRVYPNDVVRVTQVFDSGWFKCVCPWGNSEKTVYVRTNGFQFKATKYINAYNGVNGNYVGRVYPNDLVTVQQIYSSGWMKCSCPWTGGGSKIIYIRCSEIYG